MGMEEINDKINYAFVGGQSGFQIFPLEKIATSLGVSVVALRFTLGILAGKYCLRCLPETSLYISTMFDLSNKEFPPCLLHTSL